MYLAGTARRRGEENTAKAATEVEVRTIEYSFNHSELLLLLLVVDLWLKPLHICCYPPDN
jgi:hypothetical protein